MKTTILNVFLVAAGALLPATAATAIPVAERQASNDSDVNQLFRRGIESFTPYCTNSETEATLGCYNVREMISKLARGQNKPLESPPDKKWVSVANNNGDEIYLQTAESGFDMTAVEAANWALKIWLKCRPRSCDHGFKGWMKVSDDRDWWVVIGRNKTR